MTHRPITNGDGYYCSHCGAAWDRDETSPDECCTVERIPVYDFSRPGPSYFVETAPEDCSADWSKPTGRSTIPVPRSPRPPHPDQAFLMTQTPDPMAIQIGGNHYKGFALQPTEFCMRNGLDPCIHGVVKYVARWREKGGVEDLKKAIHYIQIREKFRHLIAPYVRDSGPGMITFVSRNGIGEAEAEVLYRLEAYYGSFNAEPDERAAQRVIEAIEAIIRAEEIKTA